MNEEKVPIAAQLWAQREVHPDPVAAPSHYLNHGISPTRIAELWDLPFDRANVIKYLLRAPYKGRELEDLKKALWYMLRAVNRKESQLDPEVRALRPLFDIDSKVPGEPFTPEWMDKLWTFHEERKDLIHLLRGWIISSVYEINFCGENLTAATRKVLENA